MAIVEPSIKRAITFIDGQNLFNSVKECFEYRHPNYDVLALSKHVCSMRGWTLDHARFYTGLPEITDPRSHFWQAKLRAMSQRGVRVYTRPVRNGKEKGIDVRIALDVIGLAQRGRYDVA